MVNIWCNGNMETGWQKNRIKGADKDKDEHDQCAQRCKQAKQQSINVRSCTNAQVSSKEKMVTNTLRYQQLSREDAAAKFTCQA